MNRFLSKNKKKRTFCLEYQGWISCYRSCPFNHHKILSKFPQQTPRQSSSTVMNNAPSSPQRIDPIINIPETPSHLNSEPLRTANNALITNLNSGTLNTPAKQYIPKLTSLIEQPGAHNIIAERNYEYILRIIRERKEHTLGKHHILKNLEDAEKVTQECKKKMIDKTGKKVSELSTNESEHAPISLEQIIFY